MKRDKQGGFASCSLLQLPFQLSSNLLRQRRRTSNCCRIQSNIGVISAMLGNLNAVVYEVIVWQVDWVLCSAKGKREPGGRAG